MSAANSSLVAGEVAAVAPSRSASSAGETAYALRHLQFGWWSLLLFLSLGLVLESLHGLKLSWYLGESNATRRLLWTLAHAHGSLLALVHVAFAVTLPWFGERIGPGETARASSPQPSPPSEWKRGSAVRSRALASGCLMASSVLMPAGFFLGGCVLYGGDPGLGIALVPLGAVLLFAGVFLTARALTSFSKKLLSNQTAP